MPNSTNTYCIELPSYWEVSDLLALTGLPMTASGLHGRLCGYICAGQKANGVAWLEALVRADHKNAIDRVSAKDLFLNIYRYSFSNITQMTFSFALLLPDDETELPLRAEALGEWCQGFMEGLSILGVHSENAQTEEMKDALFHIEEIGRLDYDDLSISEEDERSYTEVYEYVRMAVLSLYAELAGQASSALAQASVGNETVH